MVEQADTCKCHGNSIFVTSIDNVIIAYGTSGLCNVLHSAFMSLVRLAFCAWRQAFRSCVLRPPRSDLLPWHGITHAAAPTMISCRSTPYIQTFPAKRKAGGKPRFPPVKDTRSLFASGHGLDLLDLTAIVGTALRAHSVRQMQRTALGAGHQTGSRQLPHGAASLIASLLGYFSLRYCHVDTSLVLTA